MNKTKYPISKIRSGEVAVRIENYEQYKRLCDAVGDKDNHITNFLENIYYGITLQSYVVPLHNQVVKMLTKIDFTQIDWEEGKDIQYGTIITKEELKRAEVIGTESTEIESLRSQLASLKAENEQLRFDLKASDAENERLNKDNDELENDVIKLSKGNEKLLGKIATLEQNYDILNESQLSLEQRLAWQLYTELDNTIEDSFKKANDFLNYKGGDDEN